MRTVLKNLVDGLSEAWVRVGQYWRVPCKSSITEARQRVGCQVMSRLFHQVVSPLATAQTPGAILGGLRVMAVDGTVLDVPDTETNARVFGYPASRPGTQAAFPKVRLVLLIEAGTHLIVDALMCPYRMGERVRVKKLLRSVQSGMLLMWDRGLHSYVMVKATLATRCDYLGRVPKNVKFQAEEVLEDGSYLSWIAPDGKSKKKGDTKIMVRVIEYTIDTDESQQIYRLITSLTDIVLYPALLLATEYHQRWEVENTIDELKVHLLGRKTGGGASPAPLLFAPKTLVKLFKKSMAGSLGIGLCAHLCSKLPTTLKSPLYVWALLEHLMYYVGLCRNFSALSSEALPFFGLGL